MTVRRNSQTEPGSRRPMLTREDELAVGFLLALAFACSVGWLVFGDGARLDDIDNLPRRSAAYRITLNSAAWPEFTLVPGVGEKLAKRIVVWRTLHGPFETPGELVRVRGIGPVMLGRIRPFLDVQDNTKAEIEG